MSKYDSLKVLKQTKARTHHYCSLCDNSISKGEIYYREHIELVNTMLRMREYCASCFEKHGDALLKLK